jgi:S-adenosylmethionine synthetase
VHYQPRRHRGRIPRHRAVTAEDLKPWRAPAIKDIGYEQDGFHWRNQGRGRGRPGHHVRLCLRRDAGTDAGADPVYAHAILRRLAEARKSGKEPTLLPDAKSQLSLRYETASRSR